jgi:hypothetical protein
MKITLQISDETLRQYAVQIEESEDIAIMILKSYAVMAILKELKSEVSCGRQVVQ